jgi:signal transduction histidine kinase
MSWPRATRRGRAGVRMSVVNVTLDDLVADVRRILSGPDGPIALALTLGLGALAETFLYAADPGERASCLIANLLATLPLVFWRTRLPWVAGVVTFASLVAVASDPPLLTLSGVLAQLVVVYLVANRYRRRWSVLLALPFLVAAVAWSDEDRLEGVLLLVLVVVAQVLGDSRRQRSQAIAERDATRHAMAETQRDQLIMEERARIARELHDVVAHHVSVIAVQAETARLTTPDMPDEGKQRLAAIGQTARDSLTELRRLLGVLRADGNPEAARSPQPGLERLPELVDGARAAGTPVRLTLEGEAAPISPGVDLTAYRIVQEALTNARRHAPGASVDVRVGYEEGVLRLRVSDDGPGPPAAETSGHGLLGMHERATMVGGKLRTGAAEGGGFLVEAELPIARPAP